MNEFFIVCVQEMIYAEPNKDHHRAGKLILFVKRLKVQVTLLTDHDVCCEWRHVSLKSVTLLSLNLVKQDKKCNG